MAKRAPKVASAAKSLQDALRFASPAYKAIGEPYTTHVVLYQRQLYAHDGIIAAGCPIDDDIAVCPHGANLSAALNRTGSNLTISVGENGQVLIIKVGGFKAMVPCVAFSDIPPFAPDPMIAPIDDRIKQGFMQIAHIAADNSQHVITASVLLQAQTMVATNRAVLLEYAHYNDLPPDLVVPKIFATIVAKCDKPLKGFGYSASTVTFYFDDGSWYRTRRYADKWPDIAPIFDRTARGQMNPQMAALPTDFFEAIEAVAPFCTDNGIFETEKDLLVAGAKASQVCKGVPGGMALGAPALRLVAGRFDRVSWGADKEPIYFYADNMRGAVVKCTPRGDENHPQSLEAAQENTMHVPQTPEPVAVQFEQYGSLDN